MSRLAGLTAVVTGAGSGIGRAMALRFSAEDASVVVADIDSDRVGRVVRELTEAGGRALPVTVDVADSDQVRSMLEVATAATGRLDILCNNAAILDRLLTVDELPPDLWDRVMAVDVRGPYLGCHHAVPIMLAQGGGVILNTASVAGLAGGRAGAAYTAAKHAVIGLTKNVATTYADRGIRCNAISPGSIPTDIGGGEVSSEIGLRLRMRDEGVRPRRGLPEEVAAAALFLVSAEAAYVNGAALVVDGGYLAF